MVQDFFYIPVTQPIAWKHWRNDRKTKVAGGTWKYIHNQKTPQNLLMAFVSRLILSQSSKSSHFAYMSISLFSSCVLTVTDPRLFCCWLLRSPVWRWLICCFGVICQYLSTNVTLLLACLEFSLGREKAAAILPSLFTPFHPFRSPLLVGFVEMCMCIFMHLMADYLSGIFFCCIPYTIEAYDACHLHAPPCSTPNERVYSNIRFTCLVLRSSQTEI